MTFSDLTTIELHEAQFNFSCAHFTIFSPTRRERLHGHNYQVQASITARVEELGITFDYTIYKKKLIQLCESINSYLLLPEFSPILIINDKDPYFEVRFDEDIMLFLKKDTIILPIRNITLEELSRWFLEKLVEDQETFSRYSVSEIIVKVSNGKGRWGSSSYLLSLPP